MNMHIYRYKVHKGSLCIMYKQSYELDTKKKSKYDYLFLLLIKISLDWKFDFFFN